MGDSLITIVAIFLAATLMFIVPLMAVTERNDDIAQLAVQTATAEFTDAIAQKGEITQEDYDKYVQTLAATGNTYDIEIEAQILDENPGKKTALTSGDLIGENIYYSVYTSQIMQSVDGDGDLDYNLKKGDMVVVSAKNTNITISQLLKNFAYSVTGKGTYQVGASSTSMIVNNGR